jgi:osmoprotectant transport system substrate-binding protein
MRKTSRLLGLLAAITLSLGLAACGGDDDSGSGGGGGDTSSKGDVKVGAFNFPESVLLANIYANALNKAGYNATVTQLTTREVVQPALQKGDLDVVPEYVSSALNYYQSGAATSDDAANLAKLKEVTGAKGVTIFTPSPATDNYAFVVTKDFSDSNSITTLSQLATYSQKTPIILGAPQECADRSYCAPGLRKTYGMKIASIKTIVLSSQPAVDGLIKNDYQVAVFNSSDGVLSVNPVVVLEDDKGLNPNDFIVPAVNSKRVSPELQQALEAISAKITQEELLRMNKETQIDRRPAEKVAEEFVNDNT